MNKKNERPAELIVLVMPQPEKPGTSGHLPDIGIYMVDLHHTRSQVETVVTGEADYFLYYLPFSYRLN